MFTNITKTGIADFLNTYRAYGRTLFKLGHRSNKCQGEIEFLPWPASLNFSSISDKEWAQRLLHCNKCFKAWTVEEILKYDDSDVNMRFYMKSGKLKEGNFVLVMKDGYFGIEKADRASDRIEKLEDIWK